MKLFILAGIFLFVSLFPSSVNAVETFEPFDTLDGFTRNTQYSNPNIGSFTTQNGILSLIQPPMDYYHQVFIEKDYSIDLTQPTWFHFKVKMSEYLLGQDMYAHFRFFNHLHPDNKKEIVIGVNSEQHWLQNYFLPGGNPPCTAKSTDNEFFIAISPDIVPNAWDKRLYYPTNYTKPYTEWTEFSLKIEPLNNQTSRLSFYVDGHHVTNLIPLDEPNVSPLVLDTTYFQTQQIDRLTFGPDILIDGSEHSYPGNKYGIRGRGCYNAQSPAIPGAISYPSKFEGNDGLTYKTDWMKKFDAIASLFISKLPSIAPYSIPKSAINNLERIPPSYPQHFYLEFKNNNSQIQQAIWNGIYAGTIDFETSVLMGVIPLPAADHMIWPYHSIDTRERLELKLNHLNQYYGIHPPPLRFVLDQIYTTGNVPDIVHFGYLSPELVRSTPSIWDSLSNNDKNTIPQASVPKNGVIEWDYFWITTKPPGSPIPTPQSTKDFRDLLQLLTSTNLTIFSFNTLINQLFH